MAKQTKAPAAPQVDLKLREAFRTMEAQPPPEALTAHVDDLTGEPSKPGRAH